jgi:hypothetical protein
MGMTALVLTILGLVLCWIPLAGWVGLLLALAGAVLGVLALRKGLREERWMSIAALLLGAIAIAYGLSVQVMWINAESQLAQAGEILDDAKVQQTLEQLTNDAQKLAIEAAKKQPEAPSVAPAVQPPPIAAPQSPEPAPPATP